MLNHPFFKVLSLSLIVSVTVLSFPAQGWAMLVPVEREVVRSTDVTKVQAMLETAVIKQRLRDFGLSSEEAMARIVTLSDEQLHQFASNLEAVQAGGDILGEVIVVLLIVVLVIVILELTGHRVVMKR